MNETTTTMTMPDTKDEFYSILQHLHTSVRKTQIHLSAYGEEIATPEQVAEDDVPESHFYNFNEDRETTDEMLEMCQRLLGHLESHRIHYYPGFPAFEDATSSTTRSWVPCSRRSLNACEAAAWVCTARTISLAYIAALTEEASAVNDAQELFSEILKLLVNIDEHGKEHMQEGGVSTSAQLTATEYLKEMNPDYEAWAEEVEV